MTSKVNWPTYVEQMSLLLEVELSEQRRNELALQLERIAVLAAPLMDYPLDDRAEVGGVWKL